MNRRDTARALGALDPTVWRGSFDGGLMGTSAEALERRGLAETRWEDKPYRRIVARLSPAGLDWLIVWHDGEASRLRRARMGIVNPATAAPVEDDDFQLVDGLLRASTLAVIPSRSCQDGLAALERLAERGR